MGYSCAASIQSPKARDRMFAFLEKNYRPWGVVSGEGHYPLDPGKAFNIEGHGFIKCLK